MFGSTSLIDVLFRQIAADTHSTHINLLERLQRAQWQGTKGLREFTLASLKLLGHERNIRAVEVRMGETIRLSEHWPRARLAFILIGSGTIETDTVHAGSLVLLRSHVRIQASQNLTLLLAESG